MQEIILKTPTYVWFLFIFLIYGGWQSLGLKSNGRYTFHKVKVAIFPLIMFAFSIYRIEKILSWYIAPLYLICLLLGLWIGILSLKKSELKCLDDRHLMEAQGTIIPLLLSLSIFSLRYYIGTRSALDLDFCASLELKMLELISSLISGIFIGRVIGYWNKKIKLQAN